MPSKLITVRKKKHGTELSPNYLIEIINYPSLKIVPEAIETTGVFGPNAQSFL